MRVIKYSDFLDKAHGCWYGKCLGGAAGAPVEGLKNLIEIENFTEIFNPDLPNDDLDLQLLWLEVLEKKGTLINSCDLAQAWLEQCWYPFSEYGYFLKNYMRGIKPPYSGIINNRFFKEGMGCPIRSEIWAIISVGNPKLASEYAYVDATLDHADNSVYAEQFLAAIEAEVFFESDIEKLIRKGMEFIPSECRLATCFNRLLKLYNDGYDWLQSRQFILSEYSHPDFSNVIQNLAFIVIALLHGNCDLASTINIALKYGYDTDCTCASAASVIGIMKGYSQLDSNVTGLINDYFICGIDVKRPSDSISQLAIDTCRIVLKAPNYAVDITDCPYKADRPIDFKGFNIEYVTEEGLKQALSAVNPIKLELYGPFFEQPDWPRDTNFPSPHGEGSTLPDLVCMVNNEVFLNKEYISDFDKITPYCIIDAYEDYIDIDKYITAQGQLCCYAKAVINAPEDMTVWAIIGNNDGFSLSVNG